METKHALLIINPISGTRKKKGLDARITSRLAKAAIEVDTRWTKGPGDATSLAREALEKGYDLVIAAGGDGTINETAIALTGSAMPMAIIPCGSGNGLARHLSVPMNIDGAIDVITAGKTATIDHGTINGRPFFCTCGVGFDAAVSHEFAKASKRGFITYLKTTISQYFSYKPRHYVITTPEMQLSQSAFTVAVANASQYGNNAYIAPKASISDGLLDITVIHDGNRLGTAMVSVDLMAGRIDRNPRVSTYRTKSVVIQRDAEGPVHIDGEPLIMEATLEVEVVPQSLVVFTPEPNAPVRPFITPLRSLFKKH